jgi:hypothetical protein
VPEGVADAITELVARLRDALVGSAAVRARVAALLDEHDLGIGSAEHMVRLVVDRTVEAAGRDHELRRLNRSLGVRARYDVGAIAAALTMWNTPPSSSGDGV